MELNSKIKWVLGIFVVFVIIIATNLIDRHNFLMVKDSVSNVYNDRLVANDIVFDMLKCIHQKDVANEKNDTLFFSTTNILLNNNLGNLIDRFEQTVLTKEESEIFDDLKSNFLELKVEENSKKETKNNEITSRIAEIKSNLHDLSKIQLTEGKRQIDISNKAISSVELFTNLEIYVLIFLAILIQILVIYTPKSRVE